MRRIATIALVSVALTAASAPVLLGSAAAVLGPPLLCFPWSIGDARTIPAEPAGNGSPFAGDPEGLVTATLEVLDGSQDALVHMETLRRAVFHANSIDGRSGRANTRLAVVLLDRALRAAASERSDALPWLDAGYFLEALRELGDPLRLRGMEYLEKAARVAPSEGAIHLAVAGASFMDDTSLFGKGGNAKTQTHFAAALDRAPVGSLLRENTTAFGKHFLGEESLARLEKAHPGPKSTR